MKNKFQEQLKFLSRQHHRQHPWRLIEGVYIPHQYTFDRRQSWWDDVGFIVNGQRAIVWWQHPRMVYSDEIENRVFKMLPPFLSDFESTPIFKAVGQSRKKVDVYELNPLSESDLMDYEQRQTLQNTMEREGIEFTVTPFLRIHRLNWAISIELCLPIEILTQSDAIKLGHLARDLYTQRTTIHQLFPHYIYSREDWLHDQQTPSFEHTPGE